jgi:hypothetical protein
MSVIAASLSNAGRYYAPRMDVVALLPALAAIVAATFAVQLARQYAARHRSHALAWALALGLFALASAMVTVGVTAGWSPPVFGAYWIAGALLNVPLLAVGQLMLLDPRRTVLYWTVAGLFAVWAFAFTLLAHFDVAVLNAASAAHLIPRGAEVFAGATPDEHAAAYSLARPFSYTFAIVVIGSVWSAVRLRRWAVLLIALGVTVAAAASAFIRVGQGVLFSVFLAGGVAVMYAGFVAASRPRRTSATP